MHLYRFAVLALILGMWTPSAARARQAPPPSTVKPSVTVQEAAPGPSQADWLTIHAVDDGMVFSMPAEPTVETFNEIDGSVSVIYQSISDHALMQVYIMRPSEEVRKRRASLTPELYARVGFEVLMLGFRAEAPDAVATFERAVDQDGMRGGEGFISAPIFMVPYRARVLRTPSDAMVVIGALPLIEDSTIVARFMDSVGQVLPPHARPELRAGTRAVVEIRRAGTVAADIELPEPDWQRVAPEGGGFSIEMPPLVDPTTMQQLVNRATTKLEFRDKYMALYKQCVLICIVTPNKSRTVSPPRVVFQQAVLGFSKGAANTWPVGNPQFEGEVVRNGVRGGKGRVSIGESGVYVSFLSFETRSNLYMLTAIVLYPQPGDEKGVSRFFDSFTFVR